MKGTEEVKCLPLENQPSARLIQAKTGDLAAVTASLIDFGHGIKLIGARQYFNGSLRAGRDEAPIFFRVIKTQEDEVRAASLVLAEGAGQSHVLPENSTSDEAFLADSRDIAAKTAKMAIDI